MSVVGPGGLLQRTVTHVLLAGHNPLSPPLAYSARSRQAPSNPSLNPVPFSSWLGSIGRAQDVEHEWKILPGGISSGLGHTLIGYRSMGADRCLALGRNEMAQLGIGFASQESTRGLVEGFEGEELMQTRASVQSSYLLLRRPDGTALYANGSLHRGRLGQPISFNEERLDADTEPQLHMLSQATRVPIPPEINGIKEMATGFEHVLILTDDGDIYGTGCNTDGQLGMGSETLSDLYSFTKLDLPPKLVSDNGRIMKIRAGADTSALITKSGKVWTWGNSEYGQALQGRKIDQIHVPTPINSDFLPSSRRIVDFSCGGSFSIVLDNEGSVYSAGFGALGLGTASLSSEKVRRIDSLEGQGITRVRSGWGWAAAVRDNGSQSCIFTWGLNNEHGRLGQATLNQGRPSPRVLEKDVKGGGIQAQAVIGHVYTPNKADLPLQALGLSRSGSDENGSKSWKLGEVECGDEALWVTLVEQCSENL